MRSVCLKFAAAVMLFVVPSAIAQVPGSIRYQGKMVDGGGLANISTSMVFRFYPSASGGLPLFTETQQVLIVDGLYAVSLGASNGGPAALAQVFTNSAVFLELQVGAQVLAPREAVQSVAYAVLAGTVPDGAITAAKLASNSVGALQIADGSVSSNELAAGSVGSAQVADGSLVSADIKDGSITAEDVATNTFWQLDGNAGTTSGSDFLGTTDNQPVNFKVNGYQALRIEYAELPGFPGPNIVGGISNAVLDGGVASVIVGGGLEIQPNIITDDGAFIGGGTGNRAGDFVPGDDGDYAIVVGGQDNWAGELFAVVIGGRTNIASQPYALVGGGRNNRALEDYTVIAGGRNNTVTGSYGAVLGGYGHLVTGAYSAVGGGLFHQVPGTYGFVGAGQSNVAAGEYSAVVGGLQNRAAGRGAVVAGGQYNTVEGAGSAVLGGGGIDALLFVIVSNRVQGDFSATVAGGDNTVSGRYSVAAGGRGNAMGGSGSFIAAGGSNEVQGTYAMAGGFAAKALHNGTFVWGGTGPGAFASVHEDTFLVRATNGFGINTVSPTATLHVVGSQPLGSLVVSPDAFSDQSSELTLAESRNARYGMTFRYNGASNTLYLVGLQEYTNTAVHLAVTRSEGRVGIGTESPQFNVHVVGDDTNAVLVLAPDEASFNDDSEFVMAESRAGDYGMKWFYDGGLNKLFLYGINDTTNQGPHLVINRDNGRMGVGTEVLGSYQLSVGGAIHAEEVVVESGWADYVFQEGYPLPALADVRRHIDQHGHLPGVPAAGAVQSGGLSLGEMQTVMMQKIEELTLYVLEQQDRIEELEAALEDRRP